jgi:anti-sigma regulatory factor (Ser/Thr protein kinase)
MVMPLSLPVHARVDIERARRAARSLATAAGFAGIGIEELALAVSELATNLVRYAENGELILRITGDPVGGGVEVESRDAGPGIADLAFALREGASTGGGLGGGLPAVQRLMDSFAIDTGPAGTTIVARKWPLR